MTIHNKKPSNFLLDRVEIGYSKVRVVHSTPEDLDLSFRTAWIKENGADKLSATRLDFPIGSGDYFYIDNLIPGSYDFGFAAVDSFIGADFGLLNAQYQVDATLLDVIEHNGITLKSPLVIEGVTNTASNSSVIGISPDLVTISLSGTQYGSDMVVERCLDTSFSSGVVVVYTGPAKKELVVNNIPEGSFYFRVTSIHNFSDGTIDGVVSSSFGPVSILDDLAPPDPTGALTVEGFSFLESSVISYGFDVSWEYLPVANTPARDVIKVSWKEAGTSVTTEASTPSDSHRFLYVPFNKQLVVTTEVYGYSVAVPVIVNTFTKSINSPLKY